MPELITDDRPRIKFTAIYLGPCPLLSDVCRTRLERLSSLQEELERAGAIPILNDGLVGGNCALSNDEEDGSVLISRSGKPPGQRLTPDDFVLVERFDRSSWSAEYRTGGTDAMRPSSDTPMHMVALSPDVEERFGWSSKPTVALHGHALAETEEDLRAVEAAGMPVSEVETLFSTPEDLQALETLFVKYPFPEYKCYIRKGHGFLLLAEDLGDAQRQWRRSVLPTMYKASESTR